MGNTHCACTSKKECSSQAKSSCFGDAPSQWHNEEAPFVHGRKIPSKRSVMPDGQVVRDSTPKT
jgi:hypothetical protein